MFQFSMISWENKKKKYVALNTVEEDHIVACDVCTKVVWLCKMVSRLFDQVLDLTMIYYDNHSCVNLSENPMFHDESKHIEIKYYFLRDKVQRGEVVLQYISTDEKITNIFSKAFFQDEKFAYLRGNMRLVEMTSLLEMEVITPQVGREH
jgi:hypothetical protein